jgi:PAS domain S-box-containing protein
LDLFEKNPNPMWICDSETLQFLAVNQAAVEVYGWSREEFLAMTILDIRPEADRALVSVAAKESRTKSSYGPWRHRHKDGSERLVRVSCHFVEYNSRPAQAVTIVDVTDSVRATEALRQSEEIFRVLSASSPAGVFRARLDGYVLYANSVLARSWALTEEQMLGHQWLDYVHQDDKEPLMDGWLAANAAGRAYEHIFRIVRPDGKLRWMHGRSHIARDADGAPMISVGTTDDITTRQLAEDALRMSEAELRALTDLLPVALLYIDAKGRCRRANRTFEDWFHISREEIVAHNFDFFIRRGDGREYEQEVRRSWLLALEGLPSNFEKTAFIHGQKRNIYATYTPDRDAEGIVCGVIVLLHDITDRRALEEQFRHAQKMEAIGRLAGGIAHDFNNILSVMNGYAHLLQQELEADSRRGRMAMEIQRSGERAARLTQQLLAFSRKQISQPRIMRIDDLICDDQSMLRRLIGDSLLIEFHLGANNACIEIDPHRFSQVLLNLAVNARDATPQGGTLWIRTAIAHGRVLVAVEDTGCGMPPEIKERLFEPFFTTKEAGKGTGLGLATAYGIIREAGGSIFVESAVGKGSTFTLSLPVACEREAQNAHAEPVNGTHRGSETILLIEDDSNIRYLLAHTLKSCGYKVIEAANGIEGLALAQEKLPILDAVISDAIMPEMGGQEVIAKLRQLRPQLKAMLVSGHIDADLNGLASNAYTSFLYKPVPPDVLTAELRRLLDGRPITT